MYDGKLFLADRASIPRTLAVSLGRCYSLTVGHVGYRVNSVHWSKRPGFFDTSYAEPVLHDVEQMFAACQFQRIGLFGPLPSRQRQKLSIRDFQARAVLEWAEARGIPVEGSEIPTIKYWWTGWHYAHGGAMIEASRMRDYQPSTVEEAQSLALFDYMLRKSIAEREGDVMSGRPPDLGP